MFCYMFNELLSLHQVIHIILIQPIYLSEVMLVLKKYDKKHKKKKLIKNKNNKFKFNKLFIYTILNIFYCFNSFI